MLTALGTVLGILKILGLILLGILGLLLLLLLLVLLVPVRYQAEVSFDGLPRGKARVSWLCRFLSLGILYEKKPTVWVRVLGFPVFPGKKAAEKEKNREKSEERDSTKDAEAEVGEEGKHQEEQTARTSEVPPSEVLMQQEEQPKEEPARKRNSEKDEGILSREKELSGQGEKKKRKRTRKKIRGFSFRRIYDRLKEKLQELWSRFQQIKEKEKRLAALVKDPANQRTYHLLKRQLVKFVRHVFPGKIWGRIRFGFADPAKTGQILAAVSPFYALYAKTLEVIPVFDEAVTEGEIKLRGRIRIGTVIALGIRMLLDKNFRVLLKKLRG